MYYSGYDSFFSKKWLQINRITLSNKVIEKKRYKQKYLMFFLFVYDM